MATAWIVEYIFDQEGMGAGQGRVLAITESEIKLPDMEKWFPYFMDDRYKLLQITKVIHLVMTVGKYTPEALEPHRCKEAFDEVKSKVYRKLSDDHWEGKKIKHEK